MRRRRGTSVRPSPYLEGGVVSVVVGHARVDRRTKELVKRLAPGDIAIIDHLDLDRVAAETLVQAGPCAVVNAAASLSGAYPNVGPLLVAAAGIPILDGVGTDVLDRVVDGTVISLVGDELVVDGEIVATGTRHTLASLEAVYEQAEHNMGPALEKFVENTVAFIGKEAHLFTRGGLDVPDLGSTSAAGTSSSSSAATTTARISTCCADPATSPSSGLCSSASTAGPTPSSSATSSPM
jgi:uncharacterized membrane-anchored protein